MKIYAIIVSFHPTEELRNNVAALVKQVDEVLIVDNGSGLTTKQLLNSLIQQHPKLDVIFLPENIGLAAALNIGVKQAKSEGYEWAITFDQDSQVTPLMVDTMRRAYENCPDKEKVASLSPQYMDIYSGETYGGHLLPPFDQSLPYAKIYEALTSGNLIKLSIFDFIGYFNEFLFIDYIDTEFCWRCISAGYHILQVNDAILIHSIGFQTRCDFLWMHPIITNHSALRRYYIARNAVYIFKAYFIKQPVFLIKNLYRLAKTLIKVAILENNRKKKLKASLLGFFDGFLGRMGICTRTF